MEDRQLLYEGGMEAATVERERERKRLIFFKKKGWNRSIKGEVVTEQKTKREKWSLLLNVKGV
jgi:hypothetical protein